jgi:hypothetical protein
LAQKDSMQPPGATGAANESIDPSACKEGGPQDDKALHDKGGTTDVAPFPAFLPSRLVLMSAAVPASRKGREKRGTRVSRKNSLLSPRFHSGNGDPSTAGRDSKGESRSFAQNDKRVPHNKQPTHPSEQAHRHRRNSAQHPADLQIRDLTEKWEKAGSDPRLAALGGTAEGGCPHIEQRRSTACAPSTSSG